MKILWARLRRFWYLMFHVVNQEQKITALDVDCNVILIAVGHIIENKPHINKIFYERDL